MDSTEFEFPEGRFELRFYERRRQRYENAGTDPRQALQTCDRLRYKPLAKAAADLAGVTLDEEDQRRKNLRTEF